MDDSLDRGGGRDRVEDDPDPRPRQRSPPDGRESPRGRGEVKEGEQHGAEDGEDEDEHAEDPRAGALPLSRPRSSSLWAWSDAEDGDEDAEHHEAADDVLDLIVLDLDDDDLDADEPAPAASTVETARQCPTTTTEQPGTATQRRPRSEEAVPAAVTAPAASAASAASNVGPGPDPAGLYKGLGKRLEPFAEMAVPMDPDDPNGQSQIRERICVIERFRTENAAAEQRTQPTRLGLVDSGSLFCRICRDADAPGQGVLDHGVLDHGVLDHGVLDHGATALVSPCRCRGTVARVHVSCLEHWLAESDSSSCELCGHQYTTIRVPSYNILASIPAWMYNNGSTDLVFDCVAFLLFTPLAVLGTHMGLRPDDGADRTYVEVSLMAALDLVYSAWLTMRVHYHALSWYSWWRRKCTVKIILDSEGKPHQLTSG